MKHFVIIVIGAMFFGSFVAQRGVASDSQFAQRMLFSVVRAAHRLSDRVDRVLTRAYVKNVVAKHDQTELSATLIADAGAVSWALLAPLHKTDVIDEYFGSGSLDRDGIPAFVLAEMMVFEWSARTAAMLNATVGVYDNLKELSQLAIRYGADVSLQIRSEEGEFDPSHESEVEQEQETKVVDHAELEEVVDELTNAYMQTFSSIADDEEGEQARRTPLVVAGVGRDSRGFLRELLEAHWTNTTYGEVLHRFNDRRKSGAEGLARALDYLDKVKLTREELASLQSVELGTAWDISSSPIIPEYGRMVSIGSIMRSELWEYTARVAALKGDEEATRTFLELIFTHKIPEDRIIMTIKHPDGLKILGNRSLDDIVALYLRELAS